MILSLLFSCLWNLLNEKDKLMKTADFQKGRTDENSVHTSCLQAEASHTELCLVYESLRVSSSH